MKIYSMEKENEPRIAVIGCLHGNEKLGAEVVGRLRNNPPQFCSLDFVVANEEAMTLGKRFVDLDLNRSFPGNCESELHEERLAYTLLAEIKGCDFVIDLHSTTAKTKPFAIATRFDLNIYDMLRVASVPNAVFMNPAIAGGKSLIDYVKGISIEFDKNTSIVDAEKIVRSTIEKIISKKNGRSSQFFSKKFFEAFDILKAPKGFVPMQISNFNHISAGEILGYAEGKMIKAKQSFVPVLFGEHEYQDMICIMAKERILSDIR